MRIGFLTAEHPDELGSAGIASYLRTIIPELEILGARISLICLRNSRNADIPEGGRYNTVFIDSGTIHWYLSRIPLVKKYLPLPVRHYEWSSAFAKGVAVAKRQFGIQIVETPESGAFRNHCYGLPVVVRLHGTENVFYSDNSSLLTPSVRRSHAMLIHSLNTAAAVTSPSYANGVATYANERDAAEIRVIPNAIDASMIEKFESRSGLRNINTPVVLYLGRLSPNKGVEVLLEAWTKVIGLFTNARLLLVGPWQMQHPPSEYGLSEGAGMESNGIEWRGVINHQDVNELLQSVSLLVVPSYYEPFGIVILEAMAHRVPVIASSVGGIPEIISNGENGILIPPRSSEALSDAIVNLLRNPEKQEALSVQGHKNVNERYLPAAIAKVTYDLYKEILADEEG